MMNTLRGTKSGIHEARQILAARPRVVELFAGVGGLGLGLEQAGFHVAVAVELEDVTGRYAQYNLPATCVLYGAEAGDVRCFGDNALRVAVPRLRGELALVAGGPPCQGFSLAGKKNADDPLNDLVLEFARVVLDLRPLAFLMENVPGITQSAGTQLAEARRRLAGVYSVSDPFSLIATDFGVPQARERVFVIGIRKDLGIHPSPPQPTHLRPRANQLSFAGLPTTPTVIEAIGDIPDVDRYEALIDGDRVPYERDPESEYQFIMRGKTKDGTDRSTPIEWDGDICTNLRRTRHGDALLKRFAKLRFGEMDRLSGIRRLDPHDVSTTIRAGTTKERGSWSAPRPLHPFQNRVLTTRECARLQSFPDWFLFHPVKWHGNRQVGNAVPPRLARAIGEHLIRLLGLSHDSKQLPPVRRNDKLVQPDIIGAAASGLSRRKITQQVIHPGRQ